MGPLIFVVGLLFALPSWASQSTVVTGSFESRASAEEQLRQVTVFYQKFIVNQSKSSRAKIRQSQG